MPRHGSRNDYRPRRCWLKIQSENIGESRADKLAKSFWRNNPKNILEKKWTWKLNWSNTGRKNENIWWSLNSLKLSIWDKQDKLKLKRWFDIKRQQNQRS